MSKRTISQAVLQSAGLKQSPSGKEYSYLSINDSKKLAEEFGVTRCVVEVAALENEVIPDRYERNIGTIGIEGQMKLLKSTVGVLGAGGLGGFVVELLARMGVGRLVVVDNDNFSDSNLNRQLLSTEAGLEKAKVEAAAQRAKAINGAVTVKTHQCRGDSENLLDLFSECNLAIDCLDNLSSRYALEEVCGKLGIIMIHGAIAGFLGQIAVIRPEKPLLSAIYGEKSSNQFDKGAETQLGNPAATPAMLASWQASEAVKVLTGLEGVLDPNMMLIIDMQSGESFRVEVG